MVDTRIGDGMAYTKFPTVLLETNDLYRNNIWGTSQKVKLKHREAMQHIQPTFCWTGPRERSMGQKSERPSWPNPSTRCIFPPRPHVLIRVFGTEPAPPPALRGSNQGRREPRARQPWPVIPISSSSSSLLSCATAVSCRRCYRSRSWMRRVVVLLPFLICFWCGLETTKSFCIVLS